MEFLHGHVGEIAALGAAMCWVLTALAFAAAGRCIGATAVNLLRILLALVVLAGVHRLLLGQWIPAVDGRALTLLGVSGLVGLVVGDQFIIVALIDIGPRLSLLIATLVPPVTAVLGWTVLNEKLGWLHVGGMVVTMAGIVWVVMERPAANQNRRWEPRHRARGVVCAVIAAVCQAIGLILSKLGMGHAAGGMAEAGALQPVDPWTATLVRMAFAAVGIVVLAAVLRAGRAASPAINPESDRLPNSAGRDARRTLSFALLMVGLGVALGPVVGVWCSMVGVNETEAGVAATLMAMSPVFVLPFAVWVEKEHVSWRAVLGAVIAVAGVAMLAVTNGNQPT